MRLFVALVALCLPLPALADAGKYCVSALEAGDQAQAKRWADMILFSNTPLSPEQAALAADCLGKATGQIYVYVPEIAKFELAADHERLQVGREQKKKEGAATARAAREASAQAVKDAAAAQESRDEFLAGMERRKAERQVEVVSRLAEGCNRMFERDPDATITNKLCFDLFWEQGLPE